MTRSELVQALTQNDPHLTVAEAEKSVSVILEEITSALVKGDRVELRRFGIFTTRKRDSRQGRNPRTGTPVKVESKRIPFFKTSKELRERLNKR